MQLNMIQGVLLLLAGVEAGWAGCSLNATLLGPPPCFSLQDDCWFTLTYWQVSEEILLPVHLFSSDRAKASGKDLLRRDLTSCLDSSEDELKLYGWGIIK